jgi:hypothetical protein
MTHLTIAQIHRRVAKWDAEFRGWSANRRLKLITEMRITNVRELMHMGNLNEWAHEKKLISNDQYTYVSSRLLLKTPEEWAALDLGEQITLIDMNKEIETVIQALKKAGKLE